MWYPTKIHAAACSPVVPVKCSVTRIKYARISFDRGWQGWSRSAPVLSLLSLLSVRFYTWLHIYSVKSKERHLLSEKHLSPSLVLFLPSPLSRFFHCFLSGMYMISHSPCNNGDFISPLMSSRGKWHQLCASPFTSFLTALVWLFEGTACAECTVN